MAVLTIGLMVVFLIGCSNNDDTFSPSNVMDEMLACDLDDFSDALDGGLLADWRKLGGDGIEASTIEDDTAVSYSFTRESSAADPDRIIRLEFAKTITVTQISGKVLRIRITEGYDASTKTIGRQTVSYFATQNPDNLDAADLTDEPSTQIDEEEAVELMDEGCCLQRVELLETSPVDFFVNAYIEHENTSYTNDDWGHYERVASKER